MSSWKLKTVAQLLFYRCDRAGSCGWGTQVSPKWAMNGFLAFYTPINRQTNKTAIFCCSLFTWHFLMHYTLYLCLWSTLQTHFLFFFFDPWPSFILNPSFHKLLNFKNFSFIYSFSILICPFCWTSCHCSYSHLSHFIVHFYLDLIAFPLSFNFSLNHFHYNHTKYNYSFFSVHTHTFSNGHYRTKLIDQITT